MNIAIGIVNPTVNVPHGEFFNAFTTGIPRPAIEIIKMHIIAMDVT